MTTKAALLQSVRDKCLDCCCYQPGEVRKCPARACPLWPFRFGRDPEPSPTRGFAKKAVYTGDPGQEWGAGPRSDFDKSFNNDE